MQGLIATRAYQARSANRDPREQEADVFRRATAALRAGKAGDPAVRSKALADNLLLWNTLMIQLRDPTNGLPAPLRGAILSVGMAVRREAEQADPDFGFLIGINENITAGLCGVGPAAEPPAPLQRPSLRGTKQSRAASGVLYGPGLLRSSQ